MLNCCRVVVLKYYLSINFESKLLNDLHGFSTVGDRRGKEAESLDRWAGQGPISGCGAAMVTNLMNELRSCSL